MKVSEDAIPKYLGHGDDEPCRINKGFMYKCKILLALVKSYVFLHPLK